MPIHTYICQCKKIVEIPEEHIDFFFSEDEKNKISILIGECPECGNETHLYRGDLGVKVSPLYEGKFKVHWKE